MNPARTKPERRTHTKRHRPDPMGVQHIWRFPNGRQVSAVRDWAAVEDDPLGLWEAWDYSDDGPLGNLTPCDVRRFLRDVEAR